VEVGEQDGVVTIWIEVTEGKLVALQISTAAVPSQEPAAPALGRR
jgi:hypothetical protein